MSPGNKYRMLVRREFWEFRSLWLMPVIAGALLLIGAVFGTLHLGNGVRVTIDPAASSLTTRTAGAQVLHGSAAFIGVFAAVVIAIYLLDSLYAERKDRSILFWKSLPVSDAETVFSKLIAAMLVVPLLVLGLAVVLMPLLAGLGALLIPAMRPQVGELMVGGLVALPQLIGTGFVVLLWYAPIAAYLLLASVVARHPPLIYAALPPFVLVLAEQLLLGSRHVLQFILERLVPYLPRSPEVAAASHVVLAPGREWWKMLAEPALWLGVIAAAAMLYLVIRLRRYRDDT